MTEQWRREICEFGRKMYARNMVAANDGNISIRLPNHQILCTPTRISKGDLTPEMMCVLDEEGNVIESNGYLPSSEVKMHILVYRERPDVRAVLHSHPVYSTCFAVARQPLDAPITAEAVMFLGKVPVAPFAAPSTDEVPESIKGYVKDYNAILLANHGVLTYDKTLALAYYKMESVEFYAELMYRSGYLKPAVELSRQEIAKITALVK